MMNGNVVGAVFDILNISRISISAPPLPSGSQSLFDRNSQIAGNIPRPEFGHLTRISKDPYRKLVTSGSVISIPPMRLGHDVMQRRHPRAWQLSVPRSQVAGVYPEYLPSPSHPSVTLAEQAFHRVRALRVGDRTGLVDNLMAQGKAGQGKLEVLGEGLARKGAVDLSFAYAMARGFALVAGELVNFLQHRSSVKPYRSGNDGHQPEVAEGHAHAAIAIWSIWVFLLVSPSTPARPGG